jgi:signal peptidase II
MNKNKVFTKNKNIAIYILLAMFFVFDRYLKYLSRNLKEDVLLIKDFLTFSFYKNENISFSIYLTDNKTISFLIFFILIFIIIYLVRLFRRRDFLNFFSWMTIFVGAFSNFLDRILFSYVIDYINLKYFTIFNLADVLIFLGCFFVLFFNIKKSKAN